MRAVVVVVHGIAVVVDDVAPTAVVDDAVVAVVDAVGGASRTIRLVEEDVGIAAGVRELRVVLVDARVDHDDHDRVAPGRLNPGVGRVDVGVGHPTRLGGVPEPPQLEPRVVRHVRVRRGRKPGGGDGRRRDDPVPRRRP